MGRSGVGRECPSYALIIGWDVKGSEVPRAGICTVNMKIRVRGNKLDVVIERL
jgi:hypothetical protein